MAPATPDASAPPKASLTFGIPLRSAATARDWGKVGQLLDRTIASALNQILGDVAVIVGCHEIPDTAYRDDPRVTFLVTSIPVPATLIQQRHDKRHKKGMAAREVCRRGGGYMMILDADDLVSNRLAAHVLGDDNRRGYLIRQGYVFDVGRQHLERTAAFDQRCGSCGIFWLDRDDAGGLDDWSTKLAAAKHKEFEAVTRSAGRVLDPVPFPGGLYVFNNGENISTTSNASRDPRVRAVLDTIARTVGRFVPGRRVPSAVRVEFGLTGPLYD